MTFIEPYYVCLHSVVEALSLAAKVSLTTTQPGEKHLSSQGSEAGVRLSRAVACIAQLILDNQCLDADCLSLSFS